MPFGKRAIVYPGVTNLREIIYTDIAAKRTGNASPGDRLEELEAGNIGQGNGKMLVIGVFTN